MDIKKIVIIYSLLITFKAQPSDLTPVLQNHLDRDTTSIVEQYVYDGTIKLDPQHSSGTLGDMCGRLNQKQIRQMHDIFDHQYTAATSQALAYCNVDQNSASIIFQYLEHRYGERQIVDSIQFVPIFLAISEQHNLSQDSIPSAIARLYVKNKKAGDRIIVTDENGKEYDFKLAEDKKANMEKVTKWGNLAQELIAQGFVGNHAQMERFMANTSYFSFNHHKIAEIQKKDPAHLDDSDKDDLECWNFNIKWVVHGSKKTRKE